MTKYIKLTEWNYPIKTRLERLERNVQMPELLEAETIKHVEMKDKIYKEYLRIRKLQKTKLCSRNLIKGINILAVYMYQKGGS